MLVRNVARTAFLVGLGAFCVLLVGVWVPAFWYDEAATLQLARLPPAEFFAFVAQRDAVHAVYAAIMHAWIGVFGESEFAVRFPSVVSLAFAASAVFLLARKWGSETIAALAAGAIFVFIPRIALQSTEARSYALAVALTLAAALCAHSSVNRSRGRARSWLLFGYVCCMALAIWVFAYSVLVIPAFSVLLVGATARGGSTTFSRQWWAKWASRLWISAGIPLALSAPLLMIMVQQRGQVAWLEHERINFYTALIEPFFGWAPWLCIFALAIIIIGVRRRSVVWNQTSIILCLWLFLPGFVLVGASLFGVSLFTPRYLIVSAPALAIMLALALQKLPWRRAAAIAMVWVLGSTPFFASTRLPDAKPPGYNLRAVAQEIGGRADTGDGFMLENTGASVTRARVAFAAYPAEFADLTDLAFVESYTATGTFFDTTATPQASNLRHHSRIWVASREATWLSETLTAAGFAPHSSQRISGLTITEWLRH